MKDFNVWCDGFLLLGAVVLTGCGELKRCDSEHLDLETCSHACDRYGGDFSSALQTKAG